MGRLHSNGKGISDSAIPYSRTVPAWLKTTPAQVEEQICRLARKGVTPSQIGVVLRDSHGIAQVRIVTGMKCNLSALFNRRFLSLFVFEEFGPRPLTRRVYRQQDSANPEVPWYDLNNTRRNRAMPLHTFYTQNHI